MTVDDEIERAEREQRDDQYEFDEERVAVQRREERFQRANLNDHRVRAAQNDDADAPERDEREGGNRRGERAPSRGRRQHAQQRGQRRYQLDESAHPDDDAQQVNQVDDERERRRIADRSAVTVEALSERQEQPERDEQPQRAVRARVRRQLPPRAKEDDAQHDEGRRARNPDNAESRSGEDRRNGF